MELSVAYYFKETSAFVFPELLQGLKHPVEMLGKAKPFLESFLAGKQENHGIVKGEVPALYGNYYIGEGTEIYDNVTIIGPVYIGKNVSIMPGAVIRPGTIISDGCSVGQGSEIKASLLFSGAKVASLAFVGDSVLGKSARIGSGVITANRKFDQSTASITIQGVKTDLGRDFCGAVIGDSTRLGANSVTQPGTHIGPHTWIFPLTNVRGFIPAQKRVFVEQNLTMTDNEQRQLKD